MRLAQIEKELAKVELVRQGLRAEQAKALGRKTCTSAFRDIGCGKKFQIHTLVYIQTHNYVSPYGCTGGDYWKQGEGQFECPECGARNRLYNRPEIMELSQYFKSIEKVHEH